MSLWMWFNTLVVPLRLDSGNRGNQKQTDKQNSERFYSSSDADRSEEDNFSFDEQMFGHGKPSAPPGKTKVGRLSGSTYKPLARQTDGSMSIHRNRPPEGTYIHPSQNNVIQATDGCYYPDFLQSRGSHNMINRYPESVSLDQTPSMAKLHISDPNQGRPMSSGAPVPAAGNPIYMQDEHTMPPGHGTHPRHELHSGHMLSSMDMKPNPRTLSTSEWFGSSKPTPSHMLQEEGVRSGVRSDEWNKPMSTTKHQTGLTHDRETEERKIKEALARELHQTPKLFDAAVVYDKADYDEAVEFRDEVKMMVKRDLNESDVRIELFDSEHFEESKIYLVEDIITKCSVVFVYLTDNVRSRYFDFFVEEATAISRFGGRLGDRYILRPVHTRPEERRRYRTPVGLMTTQAIDWYEKGTAYVKDKLFSILKLAIQTRKGSQAKILNPHGHNLLFALPQPIHGTSDTSSHVNVTNLSSFSQERTDQGREFRKDGDSTRSHSASLPLSKGEANHMNQWCTNDQSPSPHALISEHSQNYSTWKESSAQYSRPQPPSSGPLYPPGYQDPSVNCPTDRLVSFASSNNPTPQTHPGGFPRYFGNTALNMGDNRQSNPTYMDHHQHISLLQMPMDMASETKETQVLYYNLQHCSSGQYGTEMRSTGYSPYMQFQSNPNTSSTWTGQRPPSSKSPFPYNNVIPYQLHLIGEAPEGRETRGPQQYPGGLQHTSSGETREQQTPLGPTIPQYSPSNKQDPFASQIQTQMQTWEQPNLSPWSFEWVSMSQGQGQPLSKDGTRSVGSHGSLDRHDTPLPSQLNVVSKVTGKLIVNPNLSTDDVEIDTKNVVQVTESDVMGHRECRQYYNRSGRGPDPSSSSEGDTSSFSEDEKQGALARSLKTMTKSRRRQTVVNITGNKILQIGNGNSVRETKHVMKKHVKKDKENKEDDYTSVPRETTNKSTITKTTKEEPKSTTTTSNSMKSRGLTSDLVDNLNTGSPKSIVTRDKSASLQKPQALNSFDQDILTVYSEPSNVTSHHLKRYSEDDTIIHSKTLTVPELNSDSLSKNCHSGSRKTYAMPHQDFRSLSKGGDSSSSNNLDDVRSDDSDSSSEDNRGILIEIVPVNIQPVPAKVSNIQLSTFGASVSNVNPDDGSSRTNSSSSIQDHVMKHALPQLNATGKIIENTNVINGVPNDLDSLTQFTSDSELFGEGSGYSTKSSIGSSLSSLLSRGSVSSVSAVTKWIKEDGDKTVSMETELD